MTPLSAEQLARGACLDLPLPVVDKYFMANAHNERFATLTAIRICGLCAVQRTCLAEAIALPAGDGVIRGGETARKLQKLHRRFQAGADLVDLTDESLDGQQLLHGCHGFPTLRRGNFTSVELAQPDVVNSTVPLMGQEV